MGLRSLKQQWRLKNAAVAVILVVAAVLRLANLGADEVRTDEGNYAVRAIGWNDFMFSTELGTPWVWYQHLDRVPAWSQLSFNDHPPLHFATMWLATRLLGVTLWAVRLPSALYGIAAVGLVIVLLRRWRCPRGALAAGAVMAVLPWHVFISRQAIQESGVIFWILLVIWLSQVVPERVQRRPTAAWAWWGMLGLALGLGLITKYSAAVVLPPLAFMAWREHWHRRRGFWALGLGLLAVVLPVIIYNGYLYRVRGHFDLQLARFFRQNTATDWPASHQALWQGDPRQAWQFVRNVAMGFSLPATALALLGLPALWRKRREIMPAAWVYSFGAASLGAGLALVTLNDYGRGSIVLPFYTLAFGLAVENIWLRLGRLLLPVVLAVLTLANLPVLGTDPILPRLVKTFWAEPIGFDHWETWRANNIPTRLQPQHYRSLVDWWEHQYAIVRQAPERTLVYDNRITWFASNWYLFRYGFYARDAAFINSGIFAYLAQHNALEELHGQAFWYLEVGRAGQDSVSQLDAQSAATHEFIRQLATRQQVTPEVIRSRDNGTLFRVWRVRWDVAVPFPNLRL